MARRIVVVGGGYAGAMCAVRVARKTRGRADVVLVSARPWFVERIRLHEDVAGAGPRRTALAAVVAGSGVRLRIGTVAGLDLALRRCLIDGVGGQREEAFDDLVLATGSVSRTRGVPGTERSWSCATEDRALALRAHLATMPGGRVVIVGGGLTGVELATELGERRPDLRVSLVTSGDAAFMLGEEAQRYVRVTCGRLGVTLREHERVAAIESRVVVLDSGEELPTDATVWCGGFEATPLAAQAGLVTDELGRAIVDARLRSASHAFVRVVGDAARVSLSASNGASHALRMACATALPQGAFCADDLARDVHGRASDEVLSFAYLVQCISLGRRAGLIHHVDAYDTPKRLWVGGRTGAWLKEMVCRYPVASIALERRGIGYAWPRAPALVAAAAPPQITTRSP